MYSKLGRGSFCFNYLLNSASHGGDQFVALLRWVWKPRFLWQWPSAHLHFLVSCFSFSYWQYLIDSLWGSWSAPKCLGKGVQWRRFSKNTMDQHQQITLHTKSSQTWKLNTGFQATWATSFSTLPPDSRTLVSKWNTKLALIWKEDFGPLDNSPILLLSPGMTPLTRTVAKFLDTSVCGALDALTSASVHSLWSSPKFLNWFCLTILIRLRFSRLVVHHFLPHFFLPLNFLLTCLDTALCEQPASLAMNVWGLPSLWRVSMIVFWTTVRSAVFPMIV